MYHRLQRIISFAFVLILVLSLTVPAFAAQGTVAPFTDTATIYLDNTKGWDSSTHLIIAEGSKNFTIKRSSVSVKGSGAKLVSFEKQYNTGFKESDWEASGSWSTENDSAYCSYYVDILAKKTGTASIRYSIGSKDYTRKVKIIAYKNPVKTITVTNVNNNKSFASLTKDQCWTQKTLKLSAAAKNAKLTVTPASGWKVNHAYITDQKTGDWNYYNFASPASKATLPLGDLKVDRDYKIDVQFLDPNANYTFYLTYHIHGVKAS